MLEQPEKRAKETSAKQDNGNAEVGNAKNRPTVKKHVFLSYCRDNIEEIARLRHDLLAAGESVWWDQDIQAGQDWKFEIRKAMNNAYVVLLCLSRESESRAVSGIYPEAMDAIAAYRQYAPGSIFLIPVRLSECEIPPLEIDATRTLDRLQYVDLFPANKHAEGIKKLLEAIRAAPQASSRTRNEMTEKPDNEKPSSPRSDEVVSTAQAWAHWFDLPPAQKINRLLVLVVTTFLPAAAWLLKASFLMAAVIVGSLGGCAMLWLVWRFRPRKGRQPVEPIPPRLRILIIILLVVSVFTAFMAFWLLHTEKQAKISRAHDDLKRSGLPPELYEHQSHLETLIIKQVLPANHPFLSDLDWLNSDKLKNFTLLGSNLSSLKGVAVANVSGLQSLEIDLDGVSLRSLNDISSPQLETLIIHRIGWAKGSGFPQIAGLPNLRKLELDFERPSSPTLPEQNIRPELNTLPALAGFTELQDLTFNLKSTSAISSLPDLSGLKHLRFVTLFLDNSRVRSLTPLKTIDHLPALTLSLDGTQLGLLSDLNNSPDIYSLNVSITSPPNDPFPNLSGISKLTSLTLHLPGLRGNGLLDKTPVPDITYLRELHELTLALEGSEVRALPKIGTLTSLQTLDLDLQGSAVEKLPDISQLHDLEQLTLDLSSTTVTELSNFAQSPTPFPKLRYLDLRLAHSPMRSLHGIEHLSALRTLILDIRGTTIEDISAIANVTGLEKLSLRMNWSQLSSLPDLAPLKHLGTLELHLEGWRETEELPKLSPLTSLRKIRLVLRESHIKDWSPLEQLNSLQDLELDLQSASTQALPDLRSLKDKGLRCVTADIRDSRINLSQTPNLPALRELAIDQGVPSLQDFPESVRKLVIGPATEVNLTCDH